MGLGGAGSPLAGDLESGPFLALSERLCRVGHLPRACGRVVPVSTVAGASHLGGADVVGLKSVSLAGADGEDVVTGCEALPCVCFHVCI